eukprot:scaffold856_cov326-Pavlova_lutheri.AAC.28
MAWELLRAAEPSSHVPRGFVCAMSSEVHERFDGSDGRHVWAPVGSSNSTYAVRETRAHADVAWWMAVRRPLGRARCPPPPSTRLNRASSNATSTSGPSFAFGRLWNLAVGRAGSESASFACRRMVSSKGRGWMQTQSTTRRPNARIRHARGRHRTLAKQETLAPAPNDSTARVVARSSGIGRRGRSRTDPCATLSRGADRGRWTVLVSLRERRHGALGGRTRTIGGGTATCGRSASHAGRGGAEAEEGGGAVVLGRRFRRIRRSHVATPRLGRRTGDPHACTRLEPSHTCVHGGDARMVRVHRRVRRSKGIRRVRGARRHPVPRTRSLRIVGKAGSRTPVQAVTVRNSPERAPRTSDYLQSWRVDVGHRKVYFIPGGLHGCLVVRSSVMV